MTGNSIFGMDRSWFVRTSYISLYDDIMNDSDWHTQIVNGAAGIGKSSFLLYTLARVRCAGKCALLHYHQTLEDTAVALFFPAGGGAPTSSFANEPNYHTNFYQWYRLVGDADSVILVDGVVSFTPDDVQGVKYITAKSPSCSIGWMDKDQNRFDRWLDWWSQAELLSYAKQVVITDANTIIEGNVFHLGGVCRYTLKKNAARNAVMLAISVVGAKELLKLVSTGLETHLAAKYDQQKIVDRLIKRKPPPSGTGIYGTTFSFASEFVASRVAMALCLETEIETVQLLQTLKGVGPVGSMRGILFEAYAARKIAEGGVFHVKEIGSATETTLTLAATTVLQKDTKTLNKSPYPPDEIENKVVWPKPSYNTPAIDMFMFSALMHTCIAFQMTVAHSHGLDLKGTKAFLSYFDSVCRALFPKSSVPKDYALYFTVPTDIYDKFSSVDNNAQSITGPLGVKLDTPEATQTGKRVNQWIMKIE